MKSCAEHTIRYPSPSKCLPDSINKQTRSCLSGVEPAATFTLLYFGVPYVPKDINQATGTDEARERVSGRSMLTPVAHSRRVGGNMRKPSWTQSTAARQSTAVLRRASGSPPAGAPSNTWLIHKGPSLRALGPRNVDIFS